MVTAIPPKVLSEEERVIIEWAKCADSPQYFVHNYCHIYDATDGSWIPFKLWKEQMHTLDIMHNHQLTVVLKARQLGLTWLCLSYAVWLMIFRPIATILIFSRRDDDATYLLGDERMRGIYNHLPKWMRTENEPVSSSHQWRLSNGSNARAFPTTGGDSYTASFVMVDEADLIPDLNKLMRSTKPTIDGGGKMVMISRSDKSQPESEFKHIYISAKANLNGWAHVFLPWNVRPSRTTDWYLQQKREIQHRTGSLDDLYEQYPETDAQALAPRTLDKRLNPEWLNNCFKEEQPLPGVGPAIPGLKVYSHPMRGQSFVVGIDPAEGNPTSDDSAITVICRETGEEVAQLAGKYEPVVIAAMADTIGIYFNYASLFPERNNHGHAVLAWLAEHSKLRVLPGFDGKPGWLNSSKGKALMYDKLADGLRNREVTIHSFDSYVQLSSIEGSTLRAPDGQMDDKATSFALAWAGIALAGAYPQFRQARVKGR